MLGTPIGNKATTGAKTWVNVAVSGPGGAIAPLSTALTRLDAARYRLDLSGLTGLAAYSLTIGPSILGTDGVAMNQNRDGTPGQPADAYRAALFGAGVTIASSVTTYDGQALVISGGTATIDGTHSFESVEIVGGAVVKFTPGSRLIVENGAAVNVPATQASPVVMTSSSR